MPKISKISSYKVVNSRGDWTLRTQVLLDDGSVGVETVPEGASKGQHEAVCVPTDVAVTNVSTKLNAFLKGKNPFEQGKIDREMIELDGTENKSNLGGNSILSVSLAIAKAAAASKKVQLYVYLQDLFSGNKKRILHFPTPLFNVLNGGKHAHNGLSFQEFMVIPTQGTAFDKAYEIGVNVYQELKLLLENGGFDVDVGDEGGFAPTGFNASKALEFIRKAISVKYKVGGQVFLGMDVAAESFWNGMEYEIKEEGLTLNSAQLKDYYSNLLKKYELIYLEDPFYEKDIDGWRDFTSQFGQRLIITADDLAVTNPKILKEITEKKLANAVIVKPNQIGTLTETLEFIREARAHNVFIIVSHRSGDTAEDTFIADLSVAISADFIKSGAPARGERVAKYNRILEIFHLNT